MSSARLAGLRGVSPRRGLNKCTCLILYDADMQTKSPGISMATQGTVATGDTTGAPDRGGKHGSLDPEWSARGPEVSP